MSTPNPPRFEPEYVYEDSFIYDPQPLFWPVLHEIMRSKHLIDIEVPGRMRRLSLNQERPNKAKLLRPLLKAEKAEQMAPMSPSVAMIAGQVWKKVHRIPDTAALSIYRDGNDFAGWHVDYEALLGPAPRDVWICIVSLGATRILDFAPLPRLPDDDEPTPCHSVTMTSGSLLIMRGETQRNFLHRVRPDPEVTGPRISLTYVFEPSEEKRDEYPWMIMSTLRQDGDDLPMPLFVGDAKAVLGYWENLVAQGLGKNGGFGLNMVSPDLRRHLTLRNARRAVLGTDHDEEFDDGPPAPKDPFEPPPSDIDQFVKCLSAKGLTGLCERAQAELSNRNPDGSPPADSDDNDNR